MQCVLFSINSCVYLKAFEDYYYIVLNYFAILYFSTYAAWPSFLSEIK